MDCPLKVMCCTDHMYPRGMLAYPSEFCLADSASWPISATLPRVGDTGEAFLVNCFGLSVVPPTEFSPIYTLPIMIFFFVVLLFIFVGRRKVPLLRWRSRWRFCWSPGWAGGWGFGWRSRCWSSWRSHCWNRKITRVVEKCISRSCNRNTVNKDGLATVLDCFLFTNGDLVPVRRSTAFTCSRYCRLGSSVGQDVLEELSLTSLSTEIDMDLDGLCVPCLAGPTIDRV